MTKMEHFSSPNDDKHVCQKPFCDREKTYETRYEHGNQSSQPKHPDKRDLKEVAK